MGIFSLMKKRKLIPLALGTYVMDIFNSCLTASREIELRKLRAAGNTGSQTLYQELAKLMPQNADIHYEFIHGKIIQLTNKCTY